MACCRLVPMTGSGCCTDVDERKAAVRPLRAWGRLRLLASRAMLCYAICCSRHKTTLSRRAPARPESLTLLWKNISEAIDSSGAGTSMYVVLYKYVYTDLWEPRSRWKNNNKNDRFSPGLILCKSHKKRLLQHYRAMTSEATWWIRGT